MAKKTVSNASRIASRYKTYESIRKIVSLPTEKRRELPIGRNGAMITPRNFGLSDTDVANLTEEWKENGKGTYVPNPQNKGFYFFAIETLKALGVNRSHSVAVVIAKFRELTHTAETKDDSGKTFWQRWKNKPSAAADDSKALPWEGKFEQNFEVLQRVPRDGDTNKTPYGLKLKEVGTKVLGTNGVVIDTLKGSQDQKMYRLNTNAAYPTNEFRVRSVVTAPAPSKARKARPRKAETATAGELVAA